MAENVKGYVPEENTIPMIDETPVTEEVTHPLPFHDKLILAQELATQWLQTVIQQLPDNIPFLKTYAQHKLGMNNSDAESTAPADIQQQVKEFIQLEARALMSDKAALTDFISTYAMNSDSSGNKKILPEEIIELLPQAVDNLSKDLSQNTDLATAVSRIGKIWEAISLDDALKELLQSEMIGAESSTDVLHAENSNNQEVDKETPTNFVEELKKRILNSERVKAIYAIFPEAQDANINWRIGFNPDGPLNAFNPLTKEIVISMEMDSVEGDVKYLNSDSSESQAVRGKIAEKVRAHVDSYKKEENSSQELISSLNELIARLEQAFPEPDTIDYIYNSYFEFSTLENLLYDHFDNDQTQKILNDIFATSLADYDYAYELLEEYKTKQVAHELTHYAAEINFPTYLFNEEQTEQIQQIVDAFILEKTGQYAIDQYSNEFDYQQILQMNNELSKKVAQSLNIEGITSEDVLDILKRNAKDEMLAGVLEHISDVEGPPEFTAQSLIQYALSGAHHFDRNPNEMMQELTLKLKGTDDNAEKRKIITDFMTQ